VRPIRRDTAAIEVAHLVKLYKTIRAVDDVSVSHCARQHHRLLGGNGAGKTHHHRHAHGAGAADLGVYPGAGLSDAEQSAEVLGRMNFESPYVDMPMRLTVQQNLTIFGRLYAVENLRERIAELARRSRSRRLPRPCQRQTLRRAEDARGAGESADQPARTAACWMRPTRRSIPIPPTGSGSIF